MVLEGRGGRGENAATLLGTQRCQVSISYPSLSLPRTFLFPVSSIILLFSFISSLTIREKKANAGTWDRTFARCFYLTRGLHVAHYAAAEHWWQTSLGRLWWTFAVLCWLPTYSAQDHFSKNNFFPTALNFEQPIESFSSWQLIFMFH